MCVFVSELCARRARAFPLVARRKRKTVSSAKTRVAPLALLGIADSSNRQPASQPRLHPQPNLKPPPRNR